MTDDRALFEQLGRRRSSVTEPPHGPRSEPDWLGRESHRRTDAYYWGQENGPNYYHPSRENPVHSSGYGLRDDLLEYRETELQGVGRRNTEQDYGPYDPEYAQWRRSQLRAQAKDHRSLQQQRNETVSEDLKTWRKKRAVEPDIDNEPQRPSGPASGGS
ncbi:hypothetical protein FVQ98_13905 [Ottowia sp. GY511]|uniref:Uncharacterized protein n=1 Tax=Ottowia flava TaxID=2675430 RepID=A0ABW4KQ17_9BURK|nr:hypothetical protein [Ottowia sp. GY511]TXK26470.1 hypothetical protein FVQ98_13905 [Ottowia sp. GY511]